MKKLLTLLLTCSIITCNAISQKSIDHWEYLFDPFQSNYYTTGPTAPEPNWMMENFAPSNAWKTGNNAMGFGSVFGGCTQCKIIEQTNSIYSRTEFEIKDTSIILAMNLYIEYLDGFVAYLNGVEIARGNLGAAGSITTVDQYSDTTHSLEQLANEAYSGFYFSKELVKKYLKMGKNLIAIELHNDKSSIKEGGYYFLFTAAISSSTVQYAMNYPDYPLTLECDSSKLPIILLTIPSKIIPDANRVKANMKIVNNGTINHISDLNFEFDGTIEIERRGSSSQSFPKHSYGLSLIGADDNEINNSLLGLPAESDWILQGEFSDRTLLRDFLTNQLVSKMGRYAPRKKLCELHINNKNMGIFILTEKIKRDSMRVNIAKLKDSDISGHDLTGGYILKLDKTTGSYKRSFSSQFKCPLQSIKPLFQIEYPKMDIIIPQQFSYIQGHINEFEKTLRSVDYKDPDKGYRKYISVKSFIDYMIIQELARNVDGYRLSTFLYKEKDKDGKLGQIHMGPVWDFNLAYGYSGILCGSNWKSDGWGYDYNHDCNGDSYYIPFWWDRLLQDASFRDELKKRWDELRTGPLHQDSIISNIDSFVTENREAINRNFLIWNNSFKNFIWPNDKIANNYTEEIEYLKKFIINRLSWIDDFLPEVHEELIYDSPTGITNSIAQLRCFPNPFVDNLTLEFMAEADKKIAIKLINMEGKLVKELNSSSTSGINRIIINDNDLNGNKIKPGIYFYSLEMNGTSVARSKIVKY